MMAFASVLVIKNMIPYFRCDVKKKSNEEVSYLAVFPVGETSWSRWRSGRRDLLVSMRSGVPVGRVPVPRRI